MGKACKANELCRFCYELQDVLWQSSAQKKSAKIAVWTSDINWSTGFPTTQSSSCKLCKLCKLHFSLILDLNPGCQHLGGFLYPFVWRGFISKAPKPSAQFEVPLQSFVLLVRFLFVAVLGKMCRFEACFFDAMFKISLDTSALGTRGWLQYAIMVLLFPQELHMWALCKVTILALEAQSSGGHWFQWWLHYRSFDLIAAWLPCTESSEVAWIRLRIMRLPTVCFEAD